MQAYTVAEFVRAQNRPLAADPALWYMREIQALLTIVRKRHEDLRGPEIETLALSLPEGAGPLAVEALLPLPGHDNQFIALERGGRQLHMLAGPAMASVLVVAASPHRWLSLAASRNGVFLLNDHGQVHRIPVLSLNGARPTRRGAAGHASSEALGAQLVATVDAGVGIDELRLTTPSHKEGRAGDSVLAYSPALDHATLITWTAASVGRRPLDVKLSAAFRAGLDLTDGLSGDADSVVMLDRRGARLFALDPFRHKAELRPLAGDGSTAGPTVVPYGDLAMARLHPVTSACRFRLSCAEIAVLEDIVAIRPESRLPADVARSLTSSEDRVQRCRQLLENLDFYVLFDDRSKIVSTVSCGSSRAALTRLAGKAPAQFLPLSPPVALQGRAALRSGDPFTQLRQTLEAQANRVCVGPDSSLLFWSSGGHEVVLLHSVTRQVRALRNDAELMRDLASRTPLRPVFEQSSR